jgi:hypothetical protein
MGFMSQANNGLILAKEEQEVIIKMRKNKHNPIKPIGG